MSEKLTAESLWNYLNNMDKTTGNVVVDHNDDGKITKAEIARAQAEVVEGFTVKMKELDGEVKDILAKPGFEQVEADALHRVKEARFYDQSEQVRERLVLLNRLTENGDFNRTQLSDILEKTNAELQERLMTEGPQSLNEIDKRDPGISPRDLLLVATKDLAK